MMKDERIWIVRLGAFGKFVRISIAYLRALPPVVHPPTQRYWWCLISITNLRNYFQFSKFYGKKSLHHHMWSLRLSKTIFDLLIAQF